MSAVGYERDVRHYEFICKDSYGIGDCLGVWAHNEEKEVVDFLKKINLNPNHILHLERTDGENNILPESMSLC